MRTACLCPLPGCTWTHEPPSPYEEVTVPPSRQAAFAAALASHPESDPLSGFAFAVTAARMLAADADIEVHLRTHTLLEWVTGISQLREWMAAVAEDLGSTGRIGALVQSAAAPESPASIARLECLELLRRDSVTG